MAMRYFKKLGPSNDVLCPTVGRIKFPTLDNLVGWFAHDNPQVQAELEACIREGRSGVTEVSAEEFKTEWIDKKKENPSGASKPLWREEMGKGALKSLSPVQALGSERVAAVVGVSGPDTPAPVSQQVRVNDPPPATGEKAEFKPTVGKRKSKLASFTKDGLAVPPAGE